MSDLKFTYIIHQYTNIRVKSNRFRFKVNDLLSIHFRYDNHTSLNWILDHTFFVECNVNCFIITITSLKIVSTFAIKVRKLLSLNQLQFKNTWLRLTSMV